MVFRFAKPRLSIIFIVFSSFFFLALVGCVPQRPNPSPDDVYAWKMEILNSPGNVLIPKITGILVHVTGSDGIIHDGKTGIYVYRGNFSSSDKGKRITFTNVVGTIYRDSIQIDFTKGGTKTVTTETGKVEPARLDVVLTKSDKDRALWDQRYVIVYGYVKKGLSATGSVTFEYYTKDSRRAQINVSIPTTILSTPVEYDMEATFTGFTQFTNGEWKLNVVDAELGKVVVGEWVYVDKVLDGLSFRSLESVYKVTGLDISMTPNAKQLLEDFINSNDGLVQVKVGRKDGGGIYHVFLFSNDGKRFYQEELLRDGKARPDLDPDVDDAKNHTRMRDAYKQAYDRKLGVYAQFSGAPMVSSAEEAAQRLNNFVVASGRVVSVETFPDYELINVDNWLKVIIKRGNYKHLFTSKLDLLRDKFVSFYGYLTKSPEGDYTIELKAEWEYFSFAGGTGTAEDPFIIETPLQLLSVRAVATQGKYFKLNADIDLSRIEWTPIGTYSTNLSQTAFQGVFDGNGYKIRNLTYNNPDGTNIGLFGYIYNSTIKNLIIENANIRAKQRAGALAGASQNSTVEMVKVVNSNIRVEFDGSGYGGGLIGDATDGTRVRQCAVVNSTISGKKYAVSGLIGQLKGTTTNPVLVENSYVQGGEVKSDYSSTTAAAGFICNYNIPDGGGSVRNNYAAVKVTNGQGFVGYIVTTGNDKGATGNYFDKDVATTSSDRLLGKGVEAKTTAEMKQQSTFVGWDFENVWKINEGVDYPRLKWEP